MVQPFSSRTNCAIISFEDVLTINFASSIVEADVERYFFRKLVQDCIRQARDNGFKILQFNAVVASNIHARHLYERIGFLQLGTIPKGFRLKNGQYEDICPYYIEV